MDFRAILVEMKAIFLLFLSFTETKMNLHQRICSPEDKGGVHETLACRTGALACAGAYLIAAAT